MKKVFALWLLTMVLVLGCGKKQSDFKLEKDTPAYQLALKVSETIPYLDPEKNNILISSKEINITTDEVIYDIRKQFGNRAGQLANMSKDQIKANINQFANILWEKEILLMEAKEANIVTDQARVDSILNMQYQRTGGEEEFQQLLKRNGQSIEDVKADISTRLTIESYINKVIYDQVRVTTGDIEKAYSEDNTATLRHILLSTQGKSDSAKKEIKKNMEEILARARNGEDFAELAKEYSEDPGSKNNGGLLEGILKGKMVKPFEEAAFSTPIGEISDIIETQFGYHILTVLERKKETKPLEEVRQQLEESLEQQKKRDAYQEHMDKVKSQYGYEVIEF